MPLTHIDGLTVPGSLSASMVSPLWVTAALYRYRSVAEKGMHFLNHKRGLQAFWTIG